MHRNRDEDGKKAVDRQRGATLVEYALIVALVASVGSVAVKGFTAVVSSVLGDVKHSIEVGQGGVETADAPTTTTTAPPTTVAPPTSTTTTTTTTTAPTTTTTTTAPRTTTTTAPPGPTKTGATFGPVTTSTTSSAWYLSTTLTVKGDNGAVLPNATVTVTLHYPVNFLGRITYTDDTVTVTTDAQGHATVSGGPYGRNTYLLGVSQVTLSVTNVTSGSVPWDGSAGSVTVLMP
ncbi:MAG: hypothetical protein JO291_06060 [Acidimicrobiia bacterium]|nr:hypothetical protein [Acidimicrobiia bacterium]